MYETVCDFDETKMAINAMVSKVFFMGLFLCAVKIKNIEEQK